MNNNPAKLGKFIIEAELGRGAMGVVYKALDPFINRTVALKTICKNLLGDQELGTNHTDTIITRFKREAQAAGLLNHPNIVSVYEYGEDQGTAFIAMEYVQGRSLKEIFDRDERFDLNAIFKIMSQILEALEYSHKHGIVHRDIKPANIIMLPDGQVKIADFGIAHVESSNLTQMGTMLGTPNYMSPEQFLGQVVDGRSDLFCAGIILYQFVTGETPFDGRSMPTVMHKVLSTEPVDPSNLNFQVSTEFNLVIKKALAKRPEDRFQTAEDFSKAIAEAFVTKSTGQKNLPTGAMDDISKTIILTEPFTPKGNSSTPGLPESAFNPYKTFFVTQPESSSAFSVSRNDKIFPAKPLPAGANAIHKFSGFSPYLKWIVICGIIGILTTGLLFSINRFSWNKTTAIPEIRDNHTTDHKLPASSDPVKTEENVLGYDKIVSMLTALGLNTTPADLSLWTDRNQFLIGDRIHYYFKAEKNCHVVIIGLTTDRKMVQFFPNRYHSNASVHAGQTYVIVDDNAEMALEVTGPAGQEDVIAFVSEQQFELFPTDFSRQPFIEISNNSDRLKMVSSRIQTAQQLNISQKRIRYQIIGN